ncbi:MAG: hypothetical protein U1D55_04500 [Phycisphaerae bacterium]
MKRTLIVFVVGLLAVLVGLGLGVGIARNAEKSPVSDAASSGGYSVSHKHKGGGILGSLNVAPTSHTSIT